MSDDINNTDQEYTTAIGIIYSIPTELHGRALLTKYEVNPVRLPKLNLILSTEFPGAKLRETAGYSNRHKRYTDFFNCVYIEFATSADACAFRLKYGHKICATECGL